MPFSNYSVDSDLMEAMRAAFHRVCDILQLSFDRDDRLTEIVITKIVELAKAGERDPEILCGHVLAELDDRFHESNHIGCHRRFLASPCVAVTS
jgi:hypothetical protein